MKAQFSQCYTTGEAAVKVMSLCFFSEMDYNSFDWFVT